jgi:hypothetical protein
MAVEKMLDGPQSMRCSFLIISLLVTVSACSSTQDTAGQLQGTVKEITRQFSGKVGDLKGDGQVATINSQCRGFARGPTDDGKYYAGFDLSPYNATSEFHLYFIFPVLPAGQVIVTNTESRIVDVWLFRSDNNYSNDVFVVRHNEEQLLRRGGQKMAGRVAIRWSSDADFVIGADVALGTNSSTWARGEFVGSTKTKLNPMLWEWPAILIFRESK